LRKIRVLHYHILKGLVFLSLYYMHYKEKVRKRAPYVSGRVA